MLNAFQVRTLTNLIRSHERIKFAVRLDFAIGLILTAFYYTHENHQRTHGPRFDYNLGSLKDNIQALSDTKLKLHKMIN